MNLKYRLTKLEKIMGRRVLCPQCGDARHPVCFYEESPDGTRRLVSGTPPAPCPACGRIASGHSIFEIVAVRPSE
jgi:hypothetical protein